METNRPANAKGQHLGKVKAIAQLVTQGLSVEDIARALDISPGIVAKRMTQIEDAARERDGLRPPGAGKGCFWVSLPAVAKKNGVAAIGIGRRGAYRLLDFDPKPAPGGVSRIQGWLSVGRLPRGNAQAEAWLASALAPALSWDEAEQRLWIALAYTNAWRLI